MNFPSLSLFGLWWSLVSNLPVVISNLEPFFIVFSPLFLWEVGVREQCGGVQLLISVKPPQLSVGTLQIWTHRFDVIKTGKENDSSCDITMRNAWKNAEGKSSVLKIFESGDSHGNNWYDKKLFSSENVGDKNTANLTQTD